jgi:hypothetical protein
LYRSRLLCIFAPLNNQSKQSKKLKMKKGLNKLMVTTVAVAAVFIIGCSKNDSNYGTPTTGSYSKCSNN